MRNGFIQKYALLAAVVGAPLFAIAKFNHAGPGFLVWVCGLLLPLFCGSLIAMLCSGVAYGSGFERIERKTKPGRFWLVFVSHVFVCCVALFGTIQGLSGYTMR
jgi:hypothetical protein